MSLMMDLLPLELLCEILALAGWEEKEDELAIRSTCRTFWAITDGTFLARHSADCLVLQPTFHPRKHQRLFRAFGITAITISILSLSGDLAACVRTRDFCRTFVLLVTKHYEYMHRCR